MIDLSPVPVTKSEFAPYGQVIDLSAAQRFPINQGLTTRYHDLFDVDVADENGRPLVNIFRTRPIGLPHRITVMERHPLGSQAFLPLDRKPFLILVAASGNAVRASGLKLFCVPENQGINLFKNTWHHSQIVINEQRDFIVIDRGGDGNNLVRTRVRDSACIPASISI